MYNYGPGIIYLCDQMNLREELLNYYINNKNSAEIINVCQKYGDTETNLWIQALKYFTKLSNGCQDQLPNILQQITNINSMSPLLVLNILSKEQGIQFGWIKNFFIQKLLEEKKEIQKDSKIVQTNKLNSDQKRQEYTWIIQKFTFSQTDTQLRTSHFSFQQQRCQACENELRIPSINFLCGHSFHEDCLISIMEETHQKKMACIKCQTEQKRVLEIKEGFDSQGQNPEQFFDLLDDAPNKFNILTQYGFYPNKIFSFIKNLYLGKGLFTKD